MTSSVWLEVAVNGPWSRARQRLIPISVEEIVAEGIACAKAGAAIVHVHAYDEATGLQNDDPEIYVRIIEGIREVSDVIVYPTIPFATTEGVLSRDSASKRYSAFEYLGKRGLLEWGVIDPGSINLATFEDCATEQPGFIYLNPKEHIQRGLQLAKQYLFTPSYAIYEPGFLRLGAALARAHVGLPPPIYRFMFTDRFTFGFPPEFFALEAYLQLLAREAGHAPWMVAGLGVDILPLIPYAVERGGHVRVGLEDAPLNTPTRNVTLVEDAVRTISSSGGQLANAREIRELLRQ